MADTTNYTWTKPDVNGSNGTWGTILNAALDAIDTDLKAVDDVADSAQADATAAQTDATAALAENLSFPIILAAGGFEESETSPKFAIRTMTEAGGSGASTPVVKHTATGGAGHSFYIPIEGLAVGMRITGFKSYGDRGDDDGTVNLIYFDETGAMSSVGGHNLAASFGEASTTGLTHDVLENKRYAFEFVANSVTVVGSYLYAVQPIVTRP